MRLAQGSIDAATTAIRRVVSTAVDPMDRAKLLPAYVEIMIAAGELQEARDACGELKAIKEEFETDVLRALAAQATGAVELADDDTRSALASFRRAFEIWQQVDAPYDAARVRVLMGAACLALGDDEAAEIELVAARAVFENLRAIPDVTRVESLQARASPRSTSPLTPREIDVLRLVAAGRTNKSIASELCLSERTIDRHVSNILTKLGVPTRSAATAWAYEHDVF